VAVLPLFNLNHQQAPGLDWIGESVAETVRESLSPAGASTGLLLLGREEREEAYHRLSLRTGVVLTKASVLKIGEVLDAGTVVFGEFSVEGTAPGPKSTLKIVLHAVDLRKFHETAVYEQTGPLEFLSQIQLKLAWLLLRSLRPASAPSEEAFLRDSAPVRLDALESYIRGLIATNADQRTRLFQQAVRLDGRFSQPNFQLGRQSFAHNDFKNAAVYLGRVTKSDSHFLEAAYLLGICRYHEMDFEAAARQFRSVLEEIPLNEVYNNLGAALSRQNNPAALEQFQKALEGDEADPDYWFNAGYSLWRQGRFAPAADRFRAVLDRSRTDQDATTLLGRCLRMEGPRAGDPRSEGRERIKTSFEDSAFRQLQAELNAGKPDNAKE
jgi:tetratricopeptide (TPR) repeat protein